MRNHDLIAHQLLNELLLVDLARCEQLIKNVLKSVHFVFTALHRILNLNSVVS